MRTLAAMLALMLTGTAAALPGASALACGPAEIECHERFARETSIAIVIAAWQEANEAKDLAEAGVAYAIGEAECVLGQTTIEGRVGCVAP